MTGKARKEGDIYGLVEKWNRNMPGDKSPGMFYKDRGSNISNTVNLSSSDV